MGDIHIGNAILMFVVFVFSLTLHEFGHAWTSDKFGDPTGRYLGRVSLNPIVHIDLFGTIILPLMGALTGIPVFGWAKPVPVNPMLWRNKVKANILVSAAGPAANVLIAVVSALLIKLLFNPNPDSVGVYNSLGSLAEPIYVLLQTAVYINVILAVFNMLPIPPLDGSHILSSILSLISEDLMEAYESIRPYGFFILVLMMFTGVFRLMYAPVRAIVSVLLSL